MSVPCRGQEAGQPARLFAAPNLSRANPFKISELENVELPVALSGFSAVALRDQQQWHMGSPRYQLVFDGQIYWFSSGRDLEIFAAAPQEYVPVLGGDCIVSFAESGQRLQGQLQHALLHGTRIYLFHDEDVMSQFREHPNRYVNSDLALDGKCVVSKFDNARDVQGLPETTAIVNGLRYQFLGDFQRRQFAANMQQYGIQRRLLMPVKGAPPAKDSQQEKKQKDVEAQAKKLKSGSNNDSLQPAYMMDGYCPVTFQEKGVWVRGSFQFKSEYHNRVYLMAGSKEKERFDADPVAFLPELGGDCLITKVDQGISVPGSVRFAAFDEKSGKLYLFAGAEQLEKFRANLEEYQMAGAIDEQAEAEENPETQETTTDQ